MRAQTAVSFRHGRGAGRTSQSSKVNDMRDLSYRETKSVAISSRTMDSSEAGRATACLREETVDAVVSSAVLQPIPDPPAALAADVPARVSSTVDWRSSSRTTGGLASGASVARSGRGLEVPAEISWEGMNSRMCRNAQRIAVTASLTRRPRRRLAGKAAWAARSLPPKQRHCWRALRSSSPVRGLVVWHGISVTYL